MTEKYGEDYYLRGPQSGLSNYVNYSWQEGPTMALAKRVIEVMGIKSGDTFLDVGCARGYLVKAMRRLAINAQGHDTSDWAVQNCDPEVKPFVSIMHPQTGFDHIWSKDTLEHMESEELLDAVSWMLAAAKKSILIIVPLERDAGTYVRDEDNFDKTHKICWPLEQWMGSVFGLVAVKKMPWTLQGSWHIPGLKPTSLSHPKSCGFITLRRI